METQITNTTGKYFTDTQITGNIKEVTEKMLAIFAAYPSQGYGTRIIFDKSDGDHRLVTIRTWNSCD